MFIIVSLPDRNAVSITQLINLPSRIHLDVPNDLGKQHPATASLLTQGQFVNCPYRHHDDPMYMIWHNHEGIEFYIRITGRSIFPARLNNLTEWVQPHRLINNFSEEAFPPLCAKGDKICPGLGIVVHFKAERAAMMSFRIRFHFSPRSWSIQVWPACRGDSRIAPMFGGREMSMRSTSTGGTLNKEQRDQEIQSSPIIFQSIGLSSSPVQTDQNFGSDD